MNNLVFGPSGAISFVDGQDTGSPSTHSDDQLAQQAPFAISHNAQQPAIAQDAPLSALLIPEAQSESAQASQNASDTPTAVTSSLSAIPSSTSDPSTPAETSASATSSATTSTSASTTQVASTESSATSTASSNSLPFPTSSLSDASMVSTSATSSSTSATSVSASATAILSSTQSEHGPPFYIGLGLLGIAAVAIIAALIAWLVRMRSVSRRRRYAASINIPWADDADGHGFTNDKSAGYAFNHATSAFIHSCEKASLPELAHLPSAMDSRDHLGPRQLQVTNMNPGDNHSVPSSGVPSPLPNEDTMGTPRAQFAPRYMSVADGGLEVPWAAPQMRPTLSARLRGRWKADVPGAGGMEHAHDQSLDQQVAPPPPDAAGWTSTLRQSVVNAFSYALPNTMGASPPADHLTAGGPPSRASTRREARRKACDLERGPSEGEYVEYVGGELVGLPHPKNSVEKHHALSRESTVSVPTFAQIPALDAYKGFDHAFSPNPMSGRFAAPALPRKSSTELTMPEGLGSLQMPVPAAVADTRVAPVSRMGTVARRDSLAVPSRRSSLAVPSRRDTMLIPSRVSSVASRMSKLSGPEEFARQRLVERAQRRRVSGCVEVEEEEDNLQ
ncbi:hypothetical protein HDZ31DRAFT_43690 [Schizophyllum fasciatum]